MTNKISFYHHVERFISPFEFSSPDQQEAIKEDIRKLPAICFTHLPSAPYSLKNPELIKEAQDLSSQIESYSGENDQDHKIALLEQQFNLYKKFIKLNKAHLSERPVRDVATDAIFTGEDLIGILKDECKKEAINLDVKKIQIISGYSSALHSISLNQTLNALNIPQKHFAVTTTPLGTTNVKDCIFLILRNRETHSTFAAHIDRNTNLDSIMEAIKQQVSQGAPVDSYIIGGQLSRGANISNMDLHNVSKVSHLMIELSKMEYDLNIRWCVLQENTPTNIVYYPGTDQFFEAVPQKELPSYYSCEILVYLDNENRQLLPYFIEKQQPHAQCSLSLSPLVQRTLQKMLDSEGNCNKKQLLETISKDLPTSLRTYTHLKAITVAYSKALKELFSIVKELSPASNAASIQKAWKNGLESNQHHSLYLLPSSKEKNISLIHEILSNL
jgi:hypothetical protein